MNAIFSLIKLFFMVLFVFALSVLFISIGAMTYGAVVETFKTQKTQSQ
jgi:hypothetical protein